MRDPHERDEACLLFNGHAGAHSWLLTGPEEDASWGRSGGVPPQPRVTGTLLAEPAIHGSRHLRTEKRDGKTYCSACKRQIHL